MSVPHKLPAPTVNAFFDVRTSSVQYVVADPQSQSCVIIDPVLDFDEKSGTVATFCADQLLDHVHQQNLKPVWILETHLHADHLSAAAYLKSRTGVPMATGVRVRDVQCLWRTLYNLPETFATDGSQWDHLFEDGEMFRVGELVGSVLFSPGHTLSSVTYLLGDAAFIHDTLFVPERGSARADFPGGSAAELWRSIQRILALPDGTRLFSGHDYPPAGQAACWQSTIGGQKAANPHVCGHDEASFVALRTARDRTLPLPRLILPALQVNIAGGRLPPPEANGRSYLRIPIGLFAGAPW